MRVCKRKMGECKQGFENVFDKYKSYKPGYFFLLNSWGDQPLLHPDSPKCENWANTVTLNPKQDKIIEDMGDYMSFTYYVNKYGFGPLNSKRTWEDYVNLIVVCAFFFSSIAVVTLLVDRTIPQEEHVSKRFDKTQQISWSTTRKTCTGLWIASAVFFFYPLLASWWYRRFAYSHSKNFQTLFWIGIILFFAALGIAVDETIKANKEADQEQKV